jgi:hypothetical protein
MYNRLTPSGGTRENSTHTYTRRYTQRMALNERCAQRAKRGGTGNGGLRGRDD